ncbi:MAG: hypothetical protein K5917_00895 [Clostridiales bacterium]|nr:hypothetical protein [Clostridiales bacterium]
MKNIVECVVYLLLALAGMTLIKMGGRSSGQFIHLLGFSVSLQTIAGMFFYGLSFLLYTFLISKMQLSITIPVLSMVSNCAVVMIGMIVFKEVLKPGQIVGITIMIAGVFIMGFFSK